MCRFILGRSSFESLDALSQPRSSPITDQSNVARRRRFGLEVVMARYACQNPVSNHLSTRLDLADDIFGFGKATSEALGLLAAPVKTLCGPAFEQLAGALADKVEHWRNIRRLDLALGVVKTMASKGIPPQAVAPSLLFPILDAGSLEEDPDLRSRWVNLLAKAASGQSDVATAYIQILSGLRAIEVQILDHVFTHGAYASTAHTSYVVPLSQVEHDLDLTRQDALLAYDNLMRLGLLLANGGTSGSEVPGFGRVTTVVRGQFILSSLGAAFIKACQPL